MATLAVQNIVEAGLEAVLGAAAGGGDVFPNDGRTFLYVANGAGSDITVTVDCKRTSTTKAGFGTVTKADAVVTVTAGERRMIGPFPEAYNNSSGQAEVSYSSATDVTVAAIRLPSVN